MLFIDNNSHVVEVYPDNSWGAPPELMDRALVNPNDLPDVLDNSSQPPVVSSSGSLAVQEFLRY